MSDRSATIVVSRSLARYPDLFRRYRITVDGDERATLKRGEQVKIQVEAGRHVVRARIDWAGSPDFDVDVTSGQRAELVVKPRENLLRRWSYLDLRPAPGGS